jgi:hypothetical protein
MKIAHKQLSICAILLISGCASVAKLELKPTNPPRSDTSGSVSIGKKLLVISGSDFEKISQFSVNRGSSTNATNYESRLFNRIYTNIERSMIQNGITPVSTATATSTIANRAVTGGQLNISALDIDNILVLREISINWSTQRIGTIGEKCYRPLHIVPLVGILDAQLLDKSGNIKWSGTVRHNSSEYISPDAYVERSDCRELQWRNTTASLCAESSPGSCKSSSPVPDEKYDSVAQDLSRKIMSVLLNR